MVDRLGVIGHVGLFLACDGVWRKPDGQFALKRHGLNGQWFLMVLMGLPDLAGPKATMDAYYEAYTAEGAGKV